MGGDKAPGEIIEGARRAVEEVGVRVALVGRPEELGTEHGLEVLPASEVIPMAADPQGITESQPMSKGFVVSVS